LAEEKKEEEDKKPKFSDPVKQYKLVYQIYSQSIEEIYFWFVGWFKDNMRHLIDPKDIENRLLFLVLRPLVPAYFRTGFLII
jgi:hypothetical protein